MCRKRLSCSESSFTESDSSPPSGARRRFSALMDTHRVASPLEADPELPVPTRQPPVKVRGTSLEGAMGTTSMGTTSSQGDFRKEKEGNGLTAGGEGIWHWIMDESWLDIHFDTYMILFLHLSALLQTSC